MKPHSEDWTCGYKEGHAGKPYVRPRNLVNENEWTLGYMEGVAARRQHVRDKDKMSALMGRLSAR